MALRRYVCNLMIQKFLDLCHELNIPVAIEKTEWANTLIVFLGILLDGRNFVLSIPLEKRDKALVLLHDLTGKKCIMVKQLQVLMGYLNFLSRAIPAGHTFTRRIYAKFTVVSCKQKVDKQGNEFRVQLKPYHHVQIDQELHFDCEVWRIFLENYRNNAVCRPIIDMAKVNTAKDLNFYSDASANERLGFGAVFNNHWLFAQWECGYIKTFKPSIEYLELLGLTAALLTWGHLLRNQRIQIYCDNMAVVAMVNNMTSSC